MNTIKILSSEDIKNLVSMKEAINTIATAFCDLSAKNVNMPLRTITDFGENELTLFYKPSLMPSLHSVGIKLLSQYKTGSKNGHPTIQGIVVLIDPENNTTQAILDGTYLTALRTGAASGVATRALSREDSETFVLFGAGAQGYTQFEAVCCARNIKKPISSILTKRPSTDLSGITKISDRSAYIREKTCPSFRKPILSAP